MIRNSTLLMTRIPASFMYFTLLVCATTGWCAPISSAARSVIPVSFEQVIAMDYDSFKNSKTSLALKEQALPEDLRTFEKALEHVGIQPEKDLDSLTFASLRNAKHELKVFGVAVGAFSSDKVLKQPSMKAAKPVKFREFTIYPMFLDNKPGAKQLWMMFLDDKTLLFGEDEALGFAISARGNEIPNLSTSRKYDETFKALEPAPVWSVLNRRGAQEMLIAAMETGSKMKEYPELRDSIFGAVYQMKLDSGVDFQLDIDTKDSTFAKDLSGMLQSGVLLKALLRNSGTKLALKNTSLNFDRSALHLRFQVDQAKMQTLLQARFFESVSSTVKNRPGSQ